MSGSRRILVVEDETLIAMDIEAHLIDYGFEVAGPCARVSDALAFVVEGELAAAILDINLRGGKSFDLAENLLSKKVPLIFISGSVEHEAPASLAGCPVLTKPISFSKLMSALESEISRFS